MNLVLAFASINVHKKQIKQDERNQIYLMSLRQLKRVLPAGCKLVIIENTGFLSSPQLTESGKNLESEFRDVDVFSLNQNTGAINKGLGELTMLKAYLELNNHLDFERIIYLTLRQIHSSPYTIQKILSSKAEIVVGNPDFYFLDGRVEVSGKERQFNDMCFGGTRETIVGYSKYFCTKQELMEAQGLSSEQLLWNYVQDNGLDIERLSMLGVIRCAGDQKSDPSAWHYI